MTPLILKLPATREGGALRPDVPDVWYDEIVEGAAFYSGSDCWIVFVAKSIDDITARIAADGLTLLQVSDCPPELQAQIQTQINMINNPPVINLTPPGDMPLPPEGR